MSKGQIVAITNEKSAYYKKKVRILEYLPDEKVSVFLICEELLLYLNLNDISQNSKTYLPKSRKDFYNFVQNAKTSRTSIVQTVRELVKSGGIVLAEGVSQNELETLIMDESKDKGQIVDEFRTIRDAGKFDFTLPNNIFVPNFKKRK